MVPSRQYRPRRGFTITEMLVTVGVIVVLAGILITALSSASRTAQKAKTDYYSSGSQKKLADSPDRLQFLFIRTSPSTRSGGFCSSFVYEDITSSDFTPVCQHQLTLQARPGP